jgi:hypothetical protein
MLTGRRGGCPRRPPIRSCSGPTAAAATRGCGGRRGAACRGAGADAMAGPAQLARLHARGAAAPARRPARRPAACARARATPVRPLPRPLAACPAPQPPTPCLPPPHPPPQKVHVILKAFNPARGNETEHHLADPPLPPNDKLPHVYTLLLTADDRWAAGGRARGWELRGGLGAPASLRAWPRPSPLPGLPLTPTDPGAPKYPPPHPRQLFRPHRRHRGGGRQSDQRERV